MPLPGPASSTPSITRQDLWFSTKDTISKIYDGDFKQIFEEEYETRYKAEFEKLGLTYFYTLIDDAVARVIRAAGGFIWALQELRRRRDERHGGHRLRQSLAMMTSVLVSPGRHHGVEAAHGTVTRHYYKYKDLVNPGGTRIRRHGSDQPGIPGRNCRTADS